LKSIFTFTDTNQTFARMPQKPIPNYDGLYGDLSARTSSEYIFLELIATRSQIFDWVIEPHIHTRLFQVFIVEQGQIYFQETAHKHQLTAPCVCFVPPTQLHGLAYSPDVQGYILTVSDSIIEDIFKTSVDIFQTFEKVQIIHQFDDEMTFQQLQSLIKMLEVELFGERSERNVMLRAYLGQFFVQIHRMKQHGEATQNNSLAINYFRKFQKNIKAADYHKTIPEFADELHITPVHLNRICKRITGKSALELVNENLIHEAQKYLLHTSYSVSEIAYLLQFEYPNYFAKLFKKHTGMSPVEFRSQQRGQ
jgi:AraC family transcriptional activator of pobA